MHIPDHGGQSYYRAKLPAHYCNIPSGNEITLEHDAYILHRVTQPIWLEVAEKLKSKGKKVFIEWDDDLWHIPVWNPAWRHIDQIARDVILESFNLADGLIASTEPLAAVMSQLSSGKHVHVLPNLIDLEQWPEPGPTHDGEVRILWAGSVHHYKDMEVVVDPLEQILLKHKNVRVLFFGDMPDSMAEYTRIHYSHLGVMIPHHRYNGRVGFVQPVELENYPETLRLLEPDIALCPLVDETFNHSKSNIKWMEMSLAGAAVLASDSPPYQCIKNWQDGDLISDNWYGAIEYLITEPGERKRIASTARTRIIKEFSWQHSKQKWINFFNEI